MIFARFLKIAKQNGHGWSGIENECPSKALSANFYYRSFALKKLHNAT